MALPLSRSGAEALSVAFARAVSAGAPETSRLVGIEHEFRVLDGTRPVDFRRLIHDLPIPGQRLDPADPNAYRGSWGGSITADGREAELAIPPQILEAGFADHVAAAAMRGRAELLRALPATLRLEGYSTHLSVAMDDRIVERAARRFATTFGPMLLLLMDGPASPGLLVRPRPGRLELGGEFVDGERLRAAIVFAAGGALAIGRAVGSRLPGSRGLPREVAIDVEPALDRYGWLVRGVTGANLHGEGRRARLRVAGAGLRERTITAQEHLEQCWTSARRALRGIAGEDELGLVDRFVAGEAALGIELDQATAIAWAGEHVVTAEAAIDPAAGPYGSAVALRRRPGLLIEPAIVGWDFVVLRVIEDLGTVTGRTAFACLPRSVLGAGLEAIDRGHLDEILRAYSNLASDVRILAGAPQTRRPGLYRAVASGAKLLAHELGPDLPGAERPGKRNRDQPRDSQPSGSQAAATVPAAAAVAAGFTLFGLPAAAAAGIAAVATVAVIGGALILGGGGPSASPTAPPSSAPLATAAPSGAPLATAVGPGVSPTLESFSGRWQFQPVDFRVVSATGGAAGGTVSQDDGNWRFTEVTDSPGLGTVTYPFELVGEREVTCAADGCFLSALYVLRVVGGELRIVWRIDNVTPIGVTIAGFDTLNCDWPSVPDGGLVRIESSGSVDGREVVTAFRFADGAWAGSGESCELDSFVVAWDVVATRLP